MTDGERKTSCRLTVRLPDGFDPRDVDLPSEGAAPVLHWPHDPRQPPVGIVVALHLSATALEADVVLAEGVDPPAWLEGAVRVPKGNKTPILAAVSLPKGSDQYVPARWRTEAP